MGDLLTASELTELVSGAEAPTSKLVPSEVRRLVENSGFRYPRKNIVFHCLKGGAAKTTLAYNCAFRLSQLGARVLLVDLDKQANSTHSFLPERPEFVFVDIVTGKARVEEVVRPVSEHLDILPSSLDNARLEMELVNRKKNPRTFYRNLLAGVRDNYDIALFDLPPDLNHNTYLTSLYADTICIPTNPDEYSVYGMKLTLSSIENLHEEYDDLKQDILVVWTKYDAREKSALHYITEFKDAGRARIMPIVVRTDSAFKHAQTQGKSVFQLGRRTNAREDIDLLTRELLGMNERFSPKGEC